MRGGDMGQELLVVAIFLELLAQAPRSRGRSQSRTDMLVIPRAPKTRLRTVPLTKSELDSEGRMIHKLVRVRQLEA